MNLIQLMKNLGLLLLGIIILTGFTTRYDMTFNNGKKITGISKPVYDESAGQYRFKTADGQEVKVSAGQVRTIEPHGDAPESPFGSSKKK